MFKLHGTVQHYDWGDKYFIPKWLGVAIDGYPWAELWFGTHHLGPTTATSDKGITIPLSEAVGELPFLIKILATQSPLSLQTHPNAEQAAIGFAREEQAGIALIARNRVYKDPNSKPELLCALTPFSALSGFKPVEATIEDWTKRGWHQLAGNLHSMRSAEFISSALSGQLPIPNFNLPDWAAVITSRYPDDPAILVALCMNHVQLLPGEMLFLPAGNLHVYLSGAGLEVMGSSDNVVRAGFTTKHIAPDEILRILDFDSEPTILRDDVDGDHSIHQSNCEFFTLTALNFTESFTISAREKPQIVVGTNVDSNHLATGQVLALAAGEQLTLTGHGQVHVVGYPTTSN